MLSPVSSASVRCEKVCSEKSNNAEHTLIIAHSHGLCIIDAIKYDGIYALESYRALLSNEVARCCEGLA